MALTNQDCIRAYRGYLEHFFNRYPDAAMQKRAMKTLRLMAAYDH